MKTSAIVALHLALGLLLLPDSGTAQIRVRAPAPPTPTPEVIVTAIDCNAYIAFVPKRQRCLSCVASGRRFFRQGDGTGGFCEGGHAAPPPPVPAPPPRAGQEYLTTPGQCAAFVVNPQKRGRCFDCVRHRGTFNKQGEYGFGACLATGAPPPPPPPPVMEAIRYVGDCNRHVHSPQKRARCYECVNRGGTFYRQGDAGFGSCSLPPPPPPPPPPPVADGIRSMGECSRRVHHPDKRASCFDCVRRGGVFYRHGAGSCSLPPPPPPPSALTTIPQCFSQISHPGMRNQCRKCITRGGRWDLHGGCRF